MKTSKERSLKKLQLELASLADFKGTLYCFFKTRVSINIQSTGANGSFPLVHILTDIAGLIFNRHSNKSAMTPDFGGGLHAHMHMPVTGICLYMDTYAMET